MYTAHRDAMTSVTPRYAEKLQVSPPLKVREGGDAWGTVEFVAMAHYEAAPNRAKRIQKFQLATRSSDGLHKV